MTMNYNIGKIDVHPCLPRMKWNEEKQKYEDDFSLVPTSVDWVSHGNYALHQPVDDKSLREDKNKKFLPMIWMELEEEYFDQILEAIKEKSLPTTPIEIFEPFWKAVLPARGMHFFETQLRAYFLDTKKNAFVFHQQTNNLTFYRTPSPIIEQMAFSVKDFKKIRDIALDKKAKRPVHYCAIG